ncbi:MAG TPA: class I adenylate-forming enzyme family protein [Gemmatimonadales bacterium]|nr:class I adenylate-forming enzyme family protein [Gemmatimonadales bacterium]
MNIARNFLATAARRPSATFLVGPDDAPHSYADVLSRARRFASLLAGRGVAPGDRVVLTFPNSVDYVCAYLGTHLLGATVALVDYRSLPAHLDFVRRDLAARLWISPAERPDYAGVPGHLVFPPDLDSYSELPEERLCPSGDAPALVMYTSGTTGTPKGVELSHDNLQHTVHSIARWAEIGSDERELTTLSLTHLFGLAHLHVHWTLGGTVIIEESLRDVNRVLERMVRWKATSFPGTPAGMAILLDRFPGAFRQAAASLRYIIVNSAPMDPAITARLLSLLPSVRCYMYYGLTEASRSTFIHYNAHPDRLATVGRATPGTEIRVGSAERPLVDEPGEILIRGPHVTRGYWGLDPAPFFDDGWLRTGDLGVLSPDGFLTWVGRVKEQINVDGLKISPGEVEEALRQHPDVADCAVVGAPDPLTGQTVVGFVVLRSDAQQRREADLRRFCKPRLELYKIPRRIRFVSEIPRTDTGKVKRLALLELESS